MKVIIVPDDGLIRAGGRLAAALGTAHDADMLSRAEYDAAAPPDDAVGVIRLLDAPDPVVEGDGEGDGYAEHGVRWGTTGRMAWVRASEVPDPQATLDAMGEVIAELQAEARQALEPLGAIPDPARMNGLCFAGLYLDPKLRVPAQTVAGGQFSFTPERMCWERQYTLGVVHFLARGFDEWASAIPS